MEKAELDKLTKDLGQLQQNEEEQESSDEP